MSEIVMRIMLVEYVRTLKRTNQRFASLGVLPAEHRLVPLEPTYAHTFLSFGRIRVES